MRKVKIKGLPSKAQGGETSGASKGLNRFMEGTKNYDKGLNQFAAPDLKMNKSISGVDREEANIEAEGGEYAVVPGEGGIPESYKINGPRHNAGGVPLNLAPDSFIFSDTKDMKIKDKEILAEFGVSVPKKGKVKAKTPADLAKNYDLNKYKEILMDPNSDMRERETAELMIENYNMKLGKLALVQESKKGFPQGANEIAMPYLQKMGQDPEQFAGNEQQPPMAAYGAGVVGDPSQYSYMYGGENQKMAKRFNGLDIARDGGQMGRFKGSAFWDSILQEGGEISMEEQFNGSVVKIDPVTGKAMLSDQNIAVRPESYIGDFYHYDTRPGVENPYHKTFGDRWRNTTKVLQPKRRSRQTTEFQDGGETDQAMFEYLEAQGFAGDTINVAGKEKYLTEKKYKPYMYTGKFKGKDQMRPFLENRAIPTDSVNAVPGVDPAQMQVHWSKSGKPTPVGPGAKDFIQSHGNYYRKGKTNPEIFPSFKQPEPSELAGSPQYQKGGPINEADYTTAYDADQALFNDALISQYGTAPSEEGFVDPATGQFITWTEYDAANKAIDTPTKVSSKPTKKYNIPKDANIVNNRDDAKPGDYVRTEDNKLYKVEVDPKSASIKNATVSGDYKPRYGSMEEDVVQAKAIIEAYSSDRNEDGKSATFKNVKRDKSGNIISADVAAGAEDLPLEHQEFLTSLFSANKGKGGLGAPGLKIGTQSSKDAKGGFYGFVGPELVEYQNWKANNPNGTVDDFEVLTPEDRLANRQNYFDLLEIDTKDMDLSDPSSIYNKDFVEKSLLPATEKLFGGDDYRPELGSTMFGIEHADAYNIATPNKFTEVEAIPEPPAPEPIVPAEPKEYIQASEDAPWWAQDIGNMAMTVNERFGLKKHLPKEHTIDLAMPDAVYYDPSRALAASNEAANMAMQANNAFAGAQGTYRNSAIAGNTFAQNANTLADYEAKNVNVANSYLDKVKGTLDKEAIANTDAMRRYFDEYTIAQQQFDNSKTALNRNMFEAWRNGLTNATKTQTMNTLYDQYNTDPSRGGITHFTQGRDQYAQVPPGGSSSNIHKGYKDFLKGKGWEDKPESYREYRATIGLADGRRGKIDPKSPYWQAYNQM